MRVGVITDAHVYRLLETSATVKGALGGMLQRSLYRNHNATFRDTPLFPTEGSGTFPIGRTCMNHGLLSSHTFLGTS